MGAHVVYSQSAYSGRSAVAMAWPALAAAAMALHSTVMARCLSPTAVARAPNADVNAAMASPDTARSTSSQHTSREDGEPQGRDSARATAVSANSVFSSRAAVTRVRVATWRVKSNSTSRSATRVTAMPQRTQRAGQGQVARRNRRQDTLATHDLATPCEPGEEMHAVAVKWRQSPNDAIISEFHWALNDFAFGSIFRKFSAHSV
jgi:hypothetical protein